MNADAHRLAAGAAVAMFVADREQRDGKTTLQPLAAGLVASVFTKLPDLVEPATSPNHRQFFHSFAFASLLGLGLYKLHQWQPIEDGDKFWRAVGMIGLGSYLIHLACDATTAKSLPLLGKL
jgi:inner membrane protein